MRRISIIKKRVSPSDNLKAYTAQHEAPKPKKTNKTYLTKLEADARRIIKNANNRNTKNAKASERTRKGIAP